MKYQNLLFSRSFHQDYRWMLSPDFLEAQDLRRLEDLVWSDETRRYFKEMGSIWPFYLIRLSNGYALCRFRRSEHVDASQRPIDCIDGIAVAKAEMKQLCVATSSLLKGQADLLNSWKQVDFEKSDALLRSEPAKSDLSLGSLRHSAPDAPRNPKIQFTKENLVFDQQSFDGLVSYLRVPAKVKQPDFLQVAFGIAPSRAALYQGFDIVVPFPMQ